MRNRFKNRETMFGNPLSLNLGVFSNWKQKTGKKNGRNIRNECWIEESKNAESK